MRFSYVLAFLDDGFTYEYSNYYSTGETVKNINSPAEFHFVTNPLSNVALIVGEQADPVIYYIRCKWI